MGQVIKWLCLLALVGCTTTTYVTRPIDIPETPQRPHLMVQDITVTTPAGVVSESYKQSVTVLMLYAKQLENIIDGLRTLNNGKEDIDPAHSGTN